MTNMTARDDLARMVSLIVGLTPAKHPLDIGEQVADAVIREWLPGVIRELPTAFAGPHVCDEVCVKIDAALRGGA